MPRSKRLSITGLLKPGLLALAATFFVMTAAPLAWAAARSGCGSCTLSTCPPSVAPFMTANYEPSVFPSLEKERELSAGGSLFQAGGAGSYGSATSRCYSCVVTTEINTVAGCGYDTTPLVGGGQRQIKDLNGPPYDPPCTGADPCFVWSAVGKDCFVPTRTPREWAGYIQYGKSAGCMGPASPCGNGTLELNEQCDNGVMNISDASTVDLACSDTSPAYCLNSTCTLPYGTICPEGQQCDTTTHTCTTNACQGDPFAYAHDCPNSLPLDLNTYSYTLVNPCVSGRCLQACDPNYYISMVTGICEMDGVCDNSNANVCLQGNPGNEVYDPATFTHTWQCDGTDGGQGDHCQLVDGCVNFNGCMSLHVNTVVCPGAAPPAAPMDYIVVAACTGAACESVCASGYIYDSGVCSPSVAACSVATWPSFTGWLGAGTAGDPYQVTNVCELQAVSNAPPASFQLLNDIDASATSTWDAGAGFAPISNFSGTLDGNGYKITGLTINRPGTSGVGLFGTGMTGTVQNLGLTGVLITGHDSVGALIGSSISGSPLISKCYVTGTVSAASSSGNVYAGGLAGNMVHGAVRKSYSKAQVTVIASGGYEYALTGGLVGGSIGDLQISDCYFAGIVNLYGSGGGIIGLAGGSVDISNVYFTGTFFGDPWVSSSIIGVMQETATLSSVFSKGILRIVNLPGLVIGNYYGGTVTNSYGDDVQVSTWTPCGSSRNHPPSGCQYLDQGIDYWSDPTKAPMSSWDFTNTWQAVGCNYPNLRHVGGMQNADNGTSCAQVNGACGAADRYMFASGTSAYDGAHPQCSAGTASSSAFPVAGGSVSWTCSGVNGGSASGTCSASQDVAPVNGVCGAANGYMFASGTSAYDGAHPQCSAGTTTNAAFPAAGGSATWGCTGSGTGHIDASGCTASRVAALSITTASPLPAGTVGTLYPPVTLAATGGTGIYRNWAVTGGSLPAGLSMSAVGVISGTPTAAVTANFTVWVTDSVGATATKSFSLTVNAPPVASGCGSVLNTCAPGTVNNISQGVTWYYWDCTGGTTISCQLAIQTCPANYIYTTGCSVGYYNPGGNCPAGYMCSGGSCS